MICHKKRHFFELLTNVFHDKSELDKKQCTSMTNKWNLPNQRLILNVKQ